MEAASSSENLCVRFKASQSISDARPTQKILERCPSYQLKVDEPHLSLGPNAKPTPYAIVDVAVSSQAHCMILSVIGLRNGIKSACADVRSFFTYRGHGL